MSTSENDKAELNVHRKLVKFSQNPCETYACGRSCSKELWAAVEEWLNVNDQPTVDVLRHIAATIHSIVYHDCNGARSCQRQNRVAASSGGRKQLLDSLDDLYRILHKLRFEKIHDEIDGSLFCGYGSRIFIFPGYPTEYEKSRGWRYEHNSFVLAENIPHPEEFSFDRVQHVVHDIDDLLNILYLTDPERKTNVGTLLCLKGRPHLVYNGPDLIWFSPLPLLKDTNRQVCPSLDPKNSRYGWFRLTLPFRVIRERYPEAYCLGTRKFNQEWCHSFLLTPDGVEVTFIQKLDQITLESSGLVRKNDGDELYQLCYRRVSSEAWDVVDFAVSVSKLVLSTEFDQVRLDFVKHSKPCVPSLKRGTKTECDSLKTEADAMWCFLKKLKENGTEISRLRNIFEDDVYRDLV